jgi:predicted Zn-ribbon and HTH transcriptional regulator
LKSIEERAEIFFEKARIQFDNKYSYNNFDYEGNDIKSFITCSLHGDFEMTPHEHRRGKGCDWCSGKHHYTTEEFIEIAKSIHGDKFDYSLVIYVNNSTKVTIICKTCGHIFEQKPVEHIHGKHGCPKCAHKVFNLEELINEFNLIHNFKYSYQKFEYKGSQVKSIITCPIHGDFLQTPGNHHYNGCPSCKESIGEKKIAAFLIRNNIEFIREKRFEDCRGKKQTMPFDFYLPDLNLLVEFQGVQHFEAIEWFGGEEQFAIRKELDQKKRDYANLKGIRYLEISYVDDLEKKLKECLSGGDLQNN